MLLCRTFSSDDDDDEDVDDDAPSSPPNSGGSNSNRYNINGLVTGDIGDVNGYDADYCNDTTSDDELSDDDDDVLMYLASHCDVDTAEGERYSVPRNYRKSALNIFEEDLDPNTGFYLSDREFKERYRCSRKELHFMSKKIEHHRVFQNRRGPKQAPIKHQLMTLLHYMGHEGVTNDTQRSTFRIGAGTCEDYRNRAKEAIRSLKEEYVYWPDENEREKFAKHYETKYSCPGAVGHMDGTLVDLVFQPQCADAADYHGRKGHWTITILIVGDDDGKVRYYLAGFPGCSHDNRVWKWSKLYQMRNMFFSPTQYLIADTAFESSEVCVSAYKLVVQNDPDNQLLNDVISVPRVRSEHVNGMVKARWPGAMKRIRKIITEDPQSLKEILSYIDCAMILHNMLVDLRVSEAHDELEEEWLRDLDEDLTDIDDPGRVDPDAEYYVSREEEAMKSSLPLGAAKDARRTLLKRYIREHHIIRYESSDDESSDDDISISMM